jgi:hypothetical protein
MTFWTGAFTAMTLQPSWNLITLPLQPVSPYNAETLLVAINAQGGQCTEIDQWDGDGWLSHPLGASYELFPVTMGKGYFVLCTQLGNFILRGYRLSSGATINLSPGYNLVGIPHPQTGYNAEGVLTAINNQGGACTEIHRWLEDGWVSYSLGYSFNNFSISPYEGYFVYCSTASSFTP